MRLTYYGALPQARAFTVHTSFPGALELLCSVELCRRLALWSTWCLHADCSTVGLRCVADCWHYPHLSLGFHADGHYLYSWGGSPSVHCLPMCAVFRCVVGRPLRLICTSCFVLLFTRPSLAQCIGVLGSLPVCFAFLSTSNGLESLRIAVAVIITPYRASFSFFAYSYWLP